MMFKRKTMFYLLFATLSLLIIECKPVGPQGTPGNNGTDGTQGVVGSSSLEVKMVGVTTSLGTGLQCRAKWTAGGGSTATCVMNLVTTGNPTWLFCSSQQTFTSVTKNTIISPTPLTGCVTANLLVTCTMSCTNESGTGMAALAFRSTP